MKKFFSLLLAASFVFALSCKTSKTGGSAQPNTLTKAEIEEGWVLLFDGKTSNGWKGNNKEHFPTRWQIVDGTLHFPGGKEVPNARDRGDIITTKEYSNFHLKLEWRIAPGGNSGIFYLGKETEGWPIYKTAPEMQVLDNQNKKSRHQK